MSHPTSPGKVVSWLLPLSLLFVAVSPGLAHKVQVAEDVGGTLHIEPNDNPQAGKPALTWVALTRKGGQQIPLEQCDCQLAVYSQPQTEDAAPLLQPPLQPISAEGYQGVPGAEIVFPQAGAYQLELSGKPKAGASFQPFQLNYQVTVAAGISAPDTQPPVAQLPNQTESGWQTPAIAISVVLGLGILGLLLWRLLEKKP